MENIQYPMERVLCCAKTRAGGLCGHLAMKNGRCRFHGGKSLLGKASARYKHGLRTKEAIERRRMLAALLRTCREWSRLLEHYERRNS